MILNFFQPSAGTLKDRKNLIHFFINRFFFNYRDKKLFIILSNFRRFWKERTNNQYLLCPILSRILS